MPQQNLLVEKHAHPQRVVYCAIYSQHLLASPSFEFLFCILLAFQMPLIRCTNIFYQGRLSRHITPPSEETCPESLPGNYMGKATLVRQLSLSHLLLAFQMLLIRCTNIFYQGRLSRHSCIKYLFKTLSNICKIDAVY